VGFVKSILSIDTQRARPIYYPHPKASFYHHHLLAIIGLTYRDESIAPETGIDEVIRFAIETMKILASQDKKTGRKVG
jgi:hypothetical protein